ncbi:MAG: PilT/PilU family type 4a pilus ATPase [Planctomycetota bacterium]
MDLKSLLEILVKDGGSDLILKTGGFPAIRACGQIKFIADTRITTEMGREYLQQVLPKNDLQRFRSLGEIDTAFSLPGLARFRLNIFRQSGELGFVFRHIQSDVPSFKDLNLPVAQLKKLCELRRGLVLTTGIAGSGKSTTMAAMVEYMNQTMSRHIVTIEDPIEYIFEDKLSIISQREVGLDSTTFGQALKHCVRQTPDVILIGEMRDQETVEAAIQAAETGHLVLSTLHTVNAVQTVERIMTFFPPHQHDLIRQQLSMNLAGVISLRLIRNKVGEGRIPAVELLLSTPTTREIISEGRTKDLHKALFEGDYYGTMTFNQSLLRLYDRDMVTHEEALASSDNADELRLLMRGIQKGTGAADLLQT